MLAWMTSLIARYNLDIHCYISGSISLSFSNWWWGFEPDGKLIKPETSVNINETFLPLLLPTYKINYLTLLNDSKKVVVILKSLNHYR